jgi:hypothetical protein
MGYDIGRFESRKFADEGVDFQIVHPVSGPVVDDDKKPVTIKLGGADSPRIKSAVRDRQAKRRAATEALPPDTPTPEYDWKAREDDMIEDLVTLTKGWSDNLELDGAPYPFSQENALALYRRFPELAEQMTAKASNRVNFMLAK